MKIILYHDNYFEDWDYRNVDIGIGGSETHQTEMSWRMAQRGYEIISYAPIPDDCVRLHRGVQWRHIDEVDWSEDGLWVIYRRPEMIDNLQDQEAWLLCQDVDYPTLNQERAEKFSKIIALTPAHATLLATRKPFLRDKIFISSNGIRMDVIREIEKNTYDRNPKRVMFASSPDRGLLETMQTFQKARRYDPDLELHTFYGFNNIDKVINNEKNKEHPAAIKSRIYKDKVMIESQKPNVFTHGRVPQRELYKEWLKTGIWLYQTNFFETSAITCMEAQALGAIPITRPYGALRDNVKHGIFIQGDAYSELNKAKYMAELINIANSLEYQESVRSEMMNYARVKFNWERIVDQWDSVLCGWDGVIGTQYNFQFRKAKGSILNVGCHTDSAKLKERLGAVNLDAFEICPQTGQQIVADVIADAREKLPKGFDTVILGDILEHFDNADCIKILKNAKQSLNDGGQVVITCPDDNREIKMGGTFDVFGGHKPMPLERLAGLISYTGLGIESQQFIDYTFAEGWGIVAKSLTL